MKNKILRFFLLCILITLVKIQYVVSSEIKFEAENIEINNEDFIKATNRVVVKDNNGTEIYGEELIIDKEKSYTISKNVIFKDINNQIEINSEKIVYYEEKRNYF